MSAPKCEESEHLCASFSLILDFLQLQQEESPSSIPDLPEAYIPAVRWSSHCSVLCPLHAYSLQTTPSKYKRPTCRTLRFIWHFKHTYIFINYIEGYYVNENSACSRCDYPSLCFLLQITSAHEFPTLRMDKISLSLPPPHENSRQISRRDTI